MSVHWVSLRGSVVLGLERKLSLSLSRTLLLVLPCNFDFEDKAKNKARL